MENFRCMPRLRQLVASEYLASVPKRTQGLAKLLLIHALRKLPLLFQ
jgi:hypothetical protein